jgi:hypothetical protein
VTPNHDAPKRIYLAGPMRGIPEFNFPRFNAVSTALRANGHEVFNPAERDTERHGGVNIASGNMDGDIEKAKATHGFSLRDALNDDLHYICKRATCLALLPGWEKSDGAQSEWRTAIALKSEGVEIVYLTEEVVKLMERAAEIMEAAE